MSFTQFNLNTDINKALGACGYTTPTPVQEKAIPSIMEGRDVLACAQTGTGKTAAFVLPALNCVSVRITSTKPRVLILTPTRELATQITTATTKYGKFMRVNMASLVGGMPYRQQLRDLSRPVDIIVATPGRLMDHMANGRLDLSAIEMLILDEADRMLDMGFIDDVKDIAAATPKTRQTLLFSATVDDRLSHIVRQLLNNPVRIDLSTETIASPLIEQKVYLADNQQHKNRLLTYFLANDNVFKAIIFSATKIHADQLAKQLRDDGFAAGALHGDLKQAVRNRTIESFRRNKIQFLIATDVAARGLDINDVTHVINYDLPKFSEDYVHRIGRTGRAGKTGIALSFALPLDARHLQKIERYIGQKIELAVVPGLEPTKRLAKGAPAGGSGGRKKFGKSDNNKSGYAHRKEGKSFGPKKSSHDEPRKYSRDERPARRDERPVNKYARDERPVNKYARDERPAGNKFSRDERPARRDERPVNKYARDERPAASKFSRDDQGPARKSSFKKDKPAGRSFDERPAGRSFSRDERPAAKSFSRDERPSRSSARPERSAGKSYARDDKPARREFSRDDKPARREFSRDDKPARARSARGDNKPAGSRFGKKSGPQESRFAPKDRKKKRSTD